MQYKPNPKRMRDGGSMIEGPGGKPKGTLTRVTKQVPYTMNDLTAEQKKKINSINLSPSAKQKAINAFAKLNK